MSQHIRTKAFVVRVLLLVALMLGSGAMPASADPCIPPYPSGPC